MSRRILLLLLPLAVVMLSSGCTIPGMSTTSATGGVSIEAFEADFSQIYSGEPVQFRLNIRNTGSVDATIKSIVLTGIDTQGGFGTSTAWSQGSGNTCDNQIPSGTKLLPANSAMGTSGQEKNCYWEYKAPNIETGLSITYSPSVRVTYEYSTSTVKSITVGSTSEIRSLMDRGQTLAADTVSSTASPISIGISIKTPIRISDSGITIPVEITMSNVGGGVVCKSTECSNPDDWNKMTIKIEAPSGANLQDCQNQEDISLWHGQSNTLGCRLTFSSPPQAGTVQKLLTVSANYGYFIEKSTSVYVTGTATSGSGI